MSEIRNWLEELDLGIYAEAFEANAIELELLPDLDEADLEKLGVAALGHRKKLLRAIMASESAAQADGKSTEAAAPGQAERRQLTVMFCDLVGSTALSRQLDPEDLRDLMRRYQDAVAAAITRYGGHVAKYLGDGVLAYFGWPRAYEDQAERAVRAGLEAIVAVGAVKKADGSQLESRIGIATGQVVVGDLVGESGLDAEAVTGETPNLAARLQNVAATDQIVVDPETRQLIGQNFATENAGSHDLKGFDDAMQAWRIIGEIQAESRFEASHDSSLSAIIGREVELDLLSERWRLATTGKGQVILISGEAGIGKSRLIEGLNDKVAEGDHVRIPYQCSPYHTNSALYPAIQHLQRQAQFAAGDGDEEKLDKLESLLRQSGADLSTEAPLLAHLLSLPYEARYGVLEKPAQQIKDAQLSALIGYFLTLAEQQPVLFLFEDTHWIDPTSQSLLDRFITRLGNARLLLMVARRPEWLSADSDHDHVTAVDLKRLDKDQGANIVRTIAGELVSSEVIDRIVARTDGVPLFIEELTKSLVEGGLDIETADIPTTLQASLLARLDRLGAEAKEISQISAVIGREFPGDLLATVSGHIASELDKALDRLIGSELVIPNLAQPQKTFTFKHALIQDAAYDSLLRARRQSLHAAIAEALEQSYSSAGDAQPEIIAQHYSLGGVPERAANFWSKAGQRASERSADLEALAHAEKGLEQVGKIPESLERDRIELDLNLTLGPALMNLKSYSAPEVEQAYARARELCARVGEPHQLFPMQFGWWVVNQMPGQYDKAAEIAEELLELAERQSDRGFILQAHHANWTTFAAQSQLQPCFNHAQKGVELYDIDQHRLHAFKYAGHDPGVCAWDHLALTSWLMGYADQATENSRNARQLAQDLENPSSQIIALVFSTWIHQYRQEPAAVLEYAKSAIAICTEHNILPNCRAAVEILHGWAEDKLDQAEDHTGEIIQGIDSWIATGGDFGRLCHYQSILAEGYIAAKRFDEAMDLIERAFPNAEGAGRLRLHAAIYNQKGDILRQLGEPHFDEAEQCLRHSIDLSQSIQGRGTELRATTNLARLWREQGKSDGAIALLTPLYNWFSEGFETQDLIDAKEFLAE